MNARKDWQARWIQDADFAGMVPLNILHKEGQVPDLPPHPRGLMNRHMLVRRTFTLEQSILNGKRFYLDITADDYFKLFINGDFIGQGPAQGYAFQYPYQRIDVSEWLQEGVNTIAVHVYYHGLICRAYNSGDFRQGMIAELFEGERLILATDHTWKYRLARQYGNGESLTIGYQTQFVEHIDSRLDERGWKEKDYNDSDWLPCHVSEQDDHVPALQSTPLLAVYHRKPARVIRMEEGHYLIDFGEEITGQFTMQALGRSGERIEIRCGEELDDSGEHVRYEMRCNCTYREYWTLSGGADCLEFYDYKAFRYVEVIGPESAMRTDSFGATVRHYPFDDNSCRLETSNPRLNRIWTVCKNSVKYGAQEQFVDCPTREKGQYLGDNTIITHSHMYASGDLRLPKKAIADFAWAAKAICPGGMGVAPGSFMQEIADFSLQWPMQLLEYYRQSGDIGFLREMEPVAAGIIGYFDRYKRTDGLLHDVADKWNLVDWPEGMRDGYDFPLTHPVGPGCHNVINAFYYGAVKTLSQIRKELKIAQEDDFPVSSNEAGLRQFRDAFNKAFYDPAERCFRDAIGTKHASLHANALPLLFGLAPNEARKPMVAWLKDKGMACSVYFAYFLLKALAAEGEYEYVYDRLTTDDFHSWGNMVKEGATCCFEAWGKDLKWNTSLCHPWASSPIPLFIESIIGLSPHMPGWECIRLDPHIPEKLERFTFECRVRTGKIRIVWEQGKLTAVVPEGVVVVAG